MGAAATALLVLVAVRFSPEPAGGDLWRAVRRRALVDRAQGRLLVFLVPLGILAGIALSLGLAPGNALQLMGALAACMIGRALVAGKAVSISYGLCFLAVSWSIVSGVVSFSTLDLGSAMAAGAVIGPRWVFGSLPSIIASVLACAAGLVAGAIWVDSAPPIPSEPLDSVLRLGESALIATAVSATIFGPSLGALVRGPLDSAALVYSALSFAITIGGVAIVSWLRTVAGKLARSGFSWPVAAASLAALILAGAAR